MRCFILFVHLMVFSSVMVKSSATPLENDEQSATKSSVYDLFSVHPMGDNIVQSTSLQQTAADKRTVRSNCYGVLDHIWYLICYFLHHIWVVFFKPWVPYSHLIGREDFEQVSNLPDESVTKNTTNSLDGRSFTNWKYFKNPKSATNL